METAQLSSEGAAAITKIHPLEVFFLASCSLDIRQWVVETITDGVEQQQSSAFLCSAESIVLVWGDCCSKCYQVSHYYAAESSLIFFFPAQFFVLELSESIVESNSEKFKPSFPEFHNKIYSCDLI